MHLVSFPVKPMVKSLINFGSMCLQIPKIWKALEWWNHRFKPLLGPFIFTSTHSKEEKIGRQLSTSFLLNNGNFIIFTFTWWRRTVWMIFIKKLSTMYICKWYICIYVVCVYKNMFFHLSFFLSFPFCFY